MEGCKFCVEHEDFPEDWWEDMPVGKVFDTSIVYCKGEITKEFAWFLEVGNIDIGIRYCPFCGRKLNKKTEEERECDDI